MATIQIDNPSLRGVEVESAFGSKTTYRKPKGNVLDVPERHARTLLAADTPGVSRYRGKSFMISAPWLPERPLNIWREPEEDHNVSTTSE